MLYDSLVNWLSGLGTSKDKQTHSAYMFRPLSKAALDMAYRGDWIARKGVDIPAKDMTRAWRSWQAAPEDITTIEDTEKALKVQLRTRQAMQMARLYGGGALYIGLDDSAGPQNEPIDLEGIKEGSLKFLHALSRYDLVAGDLETDIASINYGQPKNYIRRSLIGSDIASEIIIDQSRIVRFLGNEVLDIAQRDVQGWSDPVLQAVDDALRAASSTIANVAGLVDEAKIDIISMPELMKNFGTKDYENRLTRRFTYSNTAKSTINALLLDSTEKWERITQQFAGLPDIVKLYLLIGSAALDIPATRFLAQSPAGLNATGDSDTRNYYDMLSSEQTTVVQPAMSPLDEVIIRSATGARDDGIFYLWNPLWQMDDVQKSQIAVSYTTVFSADNAAGLINPDALREARINQLIELGVYPGLEQALDEYGDEPPMDENPVNPLTGLPVDPSKPATASTVKPPTPANENEAALFGQQKKRVNDSLNPRLFKKMPLAPRGYLKRKKLLEKRKLLKDARPRSLYMRRDVLNGKDIVAFYAKQGVPNLHDASDLHVTIIYSRDPVDWMKVGSDDWGGDKDGNLSVKPGGVRINEVLGLDKKVVTLLFSNSDLTYRNLRAREAGCSWEWDDYQPHITIADATANSDVTLKGVDPYLGVIELGPEIFEEIKEDWEAVLASDGFQRARPFDTNFNLPHGIGTGSFDPDKHPHAPGGTSIGGQFVSTHAAAIEYNKKYGTHPKSAEAFAEEPAEGSSAERTRIRHRLKVPEAEGGPGKKERALLKAKMKDSLYKSFANAVKAGNVDKIAEYKAALVKMGVHPTNLGHIEAAAAPGYAPKTTYEPVEATHQTPITTPKQALPPEDASSKYSPKQLIRMYTGSHYTGINNGLRNGALTENQWKFVDGMNKGLSDLPNYQGTVYRKVAFGKNQAEKLNFYKPGMIVEERGFTSTSTTKEKWSGDTYYTIKSKTGKSVKHLSSHPAENEVVFRSGTRFRVKQVEKAGNTPIIHMEEV